MRIPDDLLSVPIFLGGRDTDGRLYYRASAFLVGLPTAKHDVGWPCLVTAAHNVRRALDLYGNVWVRVNTRDGGAADIEIREQWVYPDNPASDVAAVPFPSLEFEPLPVPRHWFANEEAIRTRGIGIGDELVVMGLFGAVAIGAAMTRDPKTSKAIPGNRISSPPCRIPRASILTAPAEPG